MFNNPTQRGPDKPCPVRMSQAAVFFLATHALCHTPTADAYSCTHHISNYVVGQPGRAEIPAPTKHSAATPAHAKTPASRAAAAALNRTHRCPAHKAACSVPLFIPRHLPALQQQQQGPRHAAASTCYAAGAPTAASTFCSQCRRHPTPQLCTPLPCAPNAHPAASARPRRPLSTCSVVA